MDYVTLGNLEIQLIPLLVLIFETILPKEASKEEEIVLKNQLMRTLQFVPVITIKSSTACLSARLIPLLSRYLPLIRGPF